jgi:Putative beta-barrel porin 2
MNNKQISIFIITAIFLTGPACMAEEGFLVGPVLVRPAATVTWGYDDNVFLDDNDGIDDEFYSLVPRVELELPIGPHLFEFNYEYQVVRFDRFDEEDDENQRLSFEGVVDFGEKFNVQLFDSYRESSDAVLLDIANRVSRKENNYGATGVLDLCDRFAVEAGFNHNELEYTGPLVDLSQDDYRGEALVRVYENVALTAGIVSGDLEIGDDGPDADFLRYTAGVRGQIGSVVHTEIRVGLEERDYDLGSRDDLDEFYYEGTVSLRFTDTLVLDLEAFRKIAESASTVNNSYIHNKAGATLEQWLMEKAKVDVTVEYHQADYERQLAPDPRGEREDELWLYVADLSYYVTPRFIVGGGIEVAENVTDYSEFEYERNRVKFFSSFRY